MKPILYSFILPIKNEALSLPQLIKEIKQVMKGKDYEIIAINDASTDNTLTTLKALNSLIPQLNIIQSTSHQGKWTALSVGFKASEGQIIITLDSDLQDDPAEFPKLLKKLNQGYDLVSGWRKVRYDPTYKVWISRLGNLLASFLTGHHFKDLNSSFKVYRRHIIDKLPTQGSLLRFSMLFADKLGYRVAEVAINHRPRLYGKSKFGVVKYLRIIYDLILVMLLFSGSGRLKKRIDKI